jgi:hypothetical protein
MPRVLVEFQFSPPLGMTPIRNLPHRLQQRTVDKLQKKGAPYGPLTIRGIQADWNQFYPWGWGTIPRSMKSEVTATRDGINVSFAAAGRHLKLITTLGGGIFQPGRTFSIENNEGGFLSFYWKRYGRWARMIHVEHPGWEVDFLAERFAIMAQNFQRDMLDAYQRGVSEVLEKTTAPSQIKQKTRKNF